MIDWERVGTLREEVGADAFDEVAQLFLEEVDEVVERLLTAPDPMRFEHDLHFLKGSSLNLGFAALGAMCQAGEQKAAVGEAESIDIGAVIRLYRASRDEFQRAVQEPLRQRADL